MSDAKKNAKSSKGALTSLSAPQKEATKPQKVSESDGEQDPVEKEQGSTRGGQKEKEKTKKGQEKDREESGSDEEGDRDGRNDRRGDRNKDRRDDRRGKGDKEPKSKDKDKDKDKDDSRDNDEKDNKEKKFPLCRSFDDMNLKDELLRGIYAYGFESPSAIQQRAVLPIVAGNDTIAQAQSGTGKTAAFTISALQTLDFNNAKCQTLVLAPTRELAQQIRKVFASIGDFLKVSSHACVGGTSVREDVNLLTRGVQVVVGTPGRVGDMIRRNALSTKFVRMFILDEADEMLSRGFRDQIYDVFQSLNGDVQVCLFSATMPDEVLEISTRFMRNPIRILVKKEQVTLEGIKQFFCCSGA